MAINPLDNPEIYDAMQVGSLTWPLVDLSDFLLQYEWDTKKGKGAVGATKTFTQRPPAKGKIKFFLWEPQHWEQWDEFVVQLKYDPTKAAPIPVDVYNPKLSRINCNSLVTGSIGMEENEGLHLWSITVEFEQFFPAAAKSAVSTPNGSASLGGSTNSSGAQPDPVADAQQQQIQALLKQAQSP